MTSPARAVAVCYGSSPWWRTRPRPARFPRTWAYSTPGLSGAGPAVGRPTRCCPLPPAVRPILGIGLCPWIPLPDPPRSPAQDLRWWLARRDRWCFPRGALGARYPTRRPRLDSDHSEATGWL